MIAPRPSDGTDASSRVTLAEVVGYLGITAGLYGTFLVLSRQEPTETLIGAVALVLTVVFLVAGIGVGADAPDRLSRFRSVCWYLSVQSFSSMLQAWMLSPTSLLGGTGDLFPIFLLTAVYAFGLWIFLGRVLQQLAFYGAVLGALAALVAPGAGSFLFGGPDFTGLAIVFWLGGAAWFALGYAGWVRPPRAAMVLGELASIPGPLLLAADSDELAFLLVLGTSVGFLSFGGRIEDRAVSATGAVGSVVGLVGLLVAVGVDDEATGGAAIALGVGLVVVAVLLARQIGGVRPTFGRPILPIGPRPGEAADVPAGPPAIPPPPPGP